MKKRKWPKILLWIVGIFVGLFLLSEIGNSISSLCLKNYIDSFDTIEYGEDRVVPVIGEDGHYTIYADRELKIVHVTDFHIGGGFMSYKRDKKSVYELITMLQKEKPDLVIMGGDNSYAIPKFGFNGGNTINNKAIHKNVVHLFEHEGIYFSTVFGNHDTESFDILKRDKAANIYADENNKYCIFQSEFTDLDAETVPSVTNQIIEIKTTDGNLTKLLLLIDSNAYISTGFIDCAKGHYDVIHQAQIDWAKNEIAAISKANGYADGEYAKVLTVMHIPVGEYEDAYQDLFNEVRDADGKFVSCESNQNPVNTEYLFGWWDEDHIYFGGVNDKSKTPAGQDSFFETFADEMNCLEAIFCGHDHVNNNVVRYKGVMLSYGYSIDNIAYGNMISNCGKQRGITVITLEPDGDFSEEHRNAYSYYGCDPNKFVPVETEDICYPERIRSY